MPILQINLKEDSIEACPKDSVADALSTCKLTMVEIYLQEQAGNYTGVLELLCFMAKTLRDGIPNPKLVQFASLNIAFAQSLFNGLCEGVVLPLLSRVMSSKEIAMNLSAWMLDVCVENGLKFE